MLVDKYLLKIHSRPLHPTNSILHPQIMPKLNKKFPSRYSSQICSFLAGHGVVSLEGLSVSLTPPWLHTFVHVDTYLSILVKTFDKSSLIPVSDFVSNYIALNYPNCTPVYTNGSVSHEKLESLYIFRPLIFLWHTGVLMVLLLTLLS